MHALFQNFNTRPLKCMQILPRNKGQNTIQCILTSKDHTFDHVVVVNGKPKFVKMVISFNPIPLKTR